MALANAVSWRLRVLDTERRARIAVSLCFQSVRKVRKQTSESFFSRERTKTKYVLLIISIGTCLVFVHTSIAFFFESLVGLKGFLESIDMLVRF